MKFEEALAAMREGKKIRSTESSKDFYLNFVNEEVKDNRDGRFYHFLNHAFNVDWEIYEEPQKHDDEFLITDAVNAMIMVLRQKYPDICTKEYEKGLDMTTFRDRMIMGLSLELMFFRESK